MDGAAYLLRLPVARGSISFRGIGGFAPATTKIGLASLVQTSSSCCGQHLLRQRSTRSRVSRATSVWSRDEPPGDTALGALPPFRFNALRGRALAGPWPALERLFIASTRMSAQGIVAGHSSTGHGTARRATIWTALCVCEAHAVPRGCSPAQPRQRAFQPSPHRMT
jgi:hypothetical protein